MPSARFARLSLALLILAACAAPAVTTRPPAPAITPDTASAVPRPAITHAFDDYVGQYRATDNPELVISIYADSGRQWMHPTDNRRFELVAPGVSLACGSPTLSGVVFEATPEGRRPVASAPVWYNSFGPHDSTDVYTRTDAQGRYQFGGLPLGRGILVAGCSPGDIVKNMVRVEIDRDTLLDFDITLSARDCF